MYLLPMVNEKRSYLFIWKSYIRPFTTDILSAKIWSALISKRECGFKIASYVCRAAKRNVHKWLLKAKACSKNCYVSCTVEDVTKLYSVQM